MKRQVSFYILTWDKVGQASSDGHFQRFPEVVQGGTGWYRERGRK